MFFHLAPIEPRIFTSNHDNFRVSESRWSNVLWEGTDAEMAQAEADAVRKYTAAVQAETFDRVQEFADSNGRIVRVSRRWVSVKSADGMPLGSAEIWTSPLKACRILNVPLCLSVANIFVHDFARRQGVADQIHDAIAAVYGLPTVPNAVFGVDGRLSPSAQAFWSNRIHRRMVPGLSPSVFLATLQRQADMLWAQAYIETDRETKTDSIWMHRAFQLMVHTAPILARHMQKYLDETGIFAPNLRLAA